MILAHLGAVPVEEALALAPAATAMLVAVGARLRRRGGFRRT